MSFEELNRSRYSSSDEYSFSSISARSEFFDSGYSGSSLSISDFVYSQASSTDDEQSYVEDSDDLDNIEINQQFHYNDSLPSPPCSSRCSTPIKIDFDYSINLNKNYQSILRSIAMNQDIYTTEEDDDMNYFSPTSTPSLSDSFDDKLPNTKRQKLNDTDKYYMAKYNIRSCYVHLQKMD